MASHFSVHGREVCRYTVVMREIIVLLLMGIIMTTNAEETRRVTFNVTTTEPLPIGEQIFISGGDAALGNWNPDSVPLTRLEDDLWSGAVDLPTCAIEFKVTRGAWATEAMAEDGSVPPNQTIAADSDKEVAVTVRYWKDQALPPEPQIEGNYRIHNAFHSEFLRFDRKVIVWLPPSYDNKRSRRYPVLYMHDGQQVFDPQTSTHGQDWEVDEWCQKLIEEGKLKEIIVVAAYCTEDRFPEYDPDQIGQDYAQFVVTELKPFIDKEYRTLTDRASTAVAGASMGGAISFYLAWSRPDVFSGAACLSPAFKYKGSRKCLEVVEETEKTPDLKIFLSCGQGDELEEMLIGGMREMAELLRARKLRDHKNLLVVENPKAKHCEQAWRDITDQWLLFLFGK